MFRGGGRQPVVHEIAELGTTEQLTLTTYVSIYSSLNPCFIVTII